MVPSHLRFAVGVYVLGAGLLMGAPGAAVAFAKPPSSDSTARQRWRRQRFRPSALHQREKAEENAGDTDTTKGQRDSGQQPSTGTTSQTNAPGGTDATDETTDSGTGAPHRPAPHAHIRSRRTGRRGPTRSSRLQLRLRRLRSWSGYEPRRPAPVTDVVVAARARTGGAGSHPEWCARRFPMW